MRTRRIIRWTIVSVAVCAAVLGALGCLFVWRAPDDYSGYAAMDLPAPILTAEEYEVLRPTHPHPYVVELAPPAGALLLYGARHTKDPDDPQIADLKRRWQEFRPTVALVEGRMGALVEGFQDPVRTFGESGLVLGMARQQRVRAYTWEPPVDREIALVLESHPRESVALYYILRPYFSNLRHGRPSDPDDFVEEYRRKRTRWPGLEGTFASVAEIDAVWRRDFAGEKDWRDTSDEQPLPGYLHKVWKASNAARDEHFARVIIDLVRRNERVFAVSGSSHAVKLDAALRKALDAPPQAAATAADAAATAGAAGTGD